MWKMQPEYLVGVVVGKLWRHRLSLPPPPPAPPPSVAQEATPCFLGLTGHPAQGEAKEEVGSMGLYGNRPEMSHQAAPLSSKLCPSGGL